MDDLKLFSRRREARRKCAYLESVIEEGTIYLNLKNARDLYKLWREVEAVYTIKNGTILKNEKSYDFFNYAKVFYNNLSKSRIKNKIQIEEEIAYICYALGM